MEFDPLDKLADMAFAFNSVVTAVDELLAEPAPRVDRVTLASFRQSLAEPGRLLALLEEQRESAIAPKASVERDQRPMS